MKMPNWLAGCFVSFPIWWTVIYAFLLALANQITSSYGTKLYKLLPGHDLTQIWLGGHLVMWLFSLAYSSKLKFALPVLWFLIWIVGMTSLTQGALQATFEAHAGNFPGEIGR
jgi:hypothetical protein